MKKIVLVLAVTVLSLSSCELEFRDGQRYHHYWGYEHAHYPDHHEAYEHGYHHDAHGVQVIEHVR